MKKGNRKGLSPVISTILMIALVIAISGGVFLWTRGYVSKAGAETLEQQTCSQAIYKIRDFCYEDQAVYNVDTKTNEQSRKIKFNVRNENSKTEIYGFLVYLDYNSKDTKLISTLPYNTIPTQDVKSVESDFFSDTNEIKQIRSVPEIESQKKIIVCSGKETIVNWGEMKAC